MFISSSKISFYFFLILLPIRTTFSSGDFMCCLSENDVTVCLIVLFLTLVTSGLSSSKAICELYCTSDLKSSFEMITMELSVNMRRNNLTMCRQKNKYSYWKHCVTVNKTHDYSTPFLAKLTLYTHSMDVDWNGTERWSDYSLCIVFNDILFYQQHVEAFVYVCAYINMPLTIHALRIHYMYFNKCLINNLVEKHYYTQKSKKEYTSFL